MHPPAWLALILALAADNPTARMRIWRALKGLGCATLRDGVYLLPARSETFASLKSQVAQVEEAGGVAWLLQFETDAEQDAQFRALFDRSAEWQAFAADCDAFADAIAGLEAPALRKRLKGLRRQAETLGGIDFFPGPAGAVAQVRLAEMERAAHERLHPGEPRTQERSLPRLDRAEYQGRTWATRRDLWVDRVASAWLIRGFIDAQARFLWLESPAQCPPEAVGFDFDGATFTHVGKRVSFETLLASFDLESDPALLRLAHIVHSLDVGGPAPEAAGLEALLRGMKARIGGDDTRFLAEAGRLFDDYHTAFREDATPP